MNESNDFIQYVVETHMDMVLRIAYQNTLNKLQSEDIAQEAFIRLIKKQQSFCDDEHIKAWLIRITINLCKDFKKSFWNRKVEPLTQECFNFTYEQLNILEEVKKLPLKYRNVIYLYYFEGYSIGEISNILEKNENTVSSLLSRGRNKLKTLLLEEAF